MLSLQFEITRQLYIKHTPIQLWTGPVGLQAVEVLRISRHSAKEVGHIVSPTHRPLLSARRHA